MTTAANNTALENWLKQATCQLSADAANQIRTEIVEHFESALEAAMSSGTSAREAERSALAALGSPKDANRQYRKVLLTRAEARVLREGNWEVAAICSRPWLKRSLPAVPLAAFGAAAAFFVTGKPELARVLLMGALALGYWLVVPLLPVYTPGRGRIFRMVKWVLLFAVFVMAFGPPADSKRLSLMLACLWPLVWIEWTRMSIRRKMPVAQWPKQLYL
jgi:hypothetical protein